MICPTGEVTDFCKGDSTQKCPTGKSADLSAVRGETEGVARLFIVGERRGALFKLPGCCEPLVGIRLIGRVHLEPRRGIVAEEKERNCKVLLLRENGHLP